MSDIVGRGDQESEPFEIDGQTFRVNFEADNPGESPGFAFFNVVDENGGIVQPESQDLSEDDPDRIEGSAAFDSGPGNYFLEIVSKSANYAIDVEECGTSAVRRASLQPGASKSERGNENHSLPKVGGQDDNDRDLLKSGGQDNNRDLLKAGSQGSENHDLLKAGGPDEGPCPSCPAVAASRVPHREERGLPHVAASGLQPAISYQQASLSVALASESRFHERREATITRPGDNRAAGGATRYPKAEGWRLSKRKPRRRNGGSQRQRQREPRPCV